MSFLSYWREALLVMAIAVIVTLWSTIDDRDETIAGLNDNLTRVTAVAETNTKWNAATTSVLTSVIDEQNAGIDRVIKAVNQSSTDIAAVMDARRVDDAKADVAMKAYISNLPKATNCDIMMDNLIKSGGAIKW